MRAHELRVRAEFKLGQLMEQQKATVGLAKGGDPEGINQHGQSLRVETRPASSEQSPPTFKEAGIDKHLADQFAHLARWYEGRYLRSPIWIPRFTEVF